MGPPGQREFSVRIAVVGAGIVGVSTAEWLRRDGHEVVLIDPLAPGDPGQTSFGNAGLIARAAVLPVAEPGLIWRAIPMLFDRDSPLFLRWQYLPRLLPWLVPFLRNGATHRIRPIARALCDLLSDAVDQHRALAAGTPAEAFIASGDYVYLFQNRSEWDADQLGQAIRRENGYTWAELSRADLLGDDPHVGPRYQFGIRHPDHGWITDPGSYVAALAGHFVARGGRIHRARVLDITPQAGGGARVLADVPLGVEGRDAGFDHVVLSAGAWSAGLAARLGHDPMLESERGYHLMLTGANRRPPLPYMLSDARVVATPMTGGLRLAGLLELGGLNAGPRAAPVALLRRRVSQLYPDLTWTAEQTWLGHRPSTIDSLPFIGESARARGIWFAFGAQHVGLTSGPKTGRLIADQIAGRSPNIDLGPFRVGRFD